MSSKRAASTDTVVSVRSPSATGTNVEYREGDILDGTEQFLVHQCNCRTRGLKGLASAVVAKYPGSNPADTVRTPGAIVVHNDIANDRHVVNLYGQDYPGPNKRGEPREQFFRTCLQSLICAVRSRHRTDLTYRPSATCSVAFPHMIGCGLAGGNWDHYKAMIEEFASEVAADGIRVVVYQLPGGSSAAKAAEPRKKRTTATLE